MPVRFNHRAALVALAALLGSLTAARAAELDAKAVQIKTPDQFKWRDPSNQATTNQTILHGDPNKTGGIYVYINSFKPGRFGNPHYHPNDRHITVIRGTWWVGTGRTYAPQSTTPLSAGTVVTHFAKQFHYDGAKDENVILEITGEGPQ